MFPCIITVMLQEYYMQLCNLIVKIYTKKEIKNQSKKDVLLKKKLNLKNASPCLAC